MEPIQKQPSSDGKVEAGLLESKVRRGVLTVKMALKNASQSRITPEIMFKDVYYASIDEEKKYCVVKGANSIYSPSVH
jgi:hypothetical protein